MNQGPIVAPCVPPRSFSSSAQLHLDAIHDQPVTSDSERSFDQRSDVEWEGSAQQKKSTLDAKSEEIAIELAREDECPPGRLERIPDVELDEAGKTFLWNLEVPFETTQARVLDLCSQYMYPVVIIASLLHYSHKRPVWTVLCCLLLYGITAKELAVLDAMLNVHILQLVVDILKDVCRTPRPNWRWRFPHSIHKLERCYSFPSGHTAFVSSVFYILALQQSEANSKFAPLCWCLFVLGSVVVCISRCTLCLHWVSDVLASIVLNIVICTTVFFAAPIQRLGTSPESTLITCIAANAITVLIYGITVWMVPMGHTRDSYRNASQAENAYEASMKTTMMPVIATDALFYSAIAGGMYINWKTSMETFDGPSGISDGKMLVVSALGCTALIKVLDVARAHFDVKTGSTLERALKMVIYSISALWMTVGTRWALSKKV